MKPQAPEPDARDLATACVLCNKACGLRVDVADGRITGVRPDPSSPVSEGFMCNKARTIGRYAHHAQRLSVPLRRNEAGDFEPVSWDEAIAEIGARLTALRDAHGPNAVGILGLGGQTNHLDVMSGDLLQHGLGSGRIYHTLAQEKSQHFLVGEWMFGSPPDRVPYADLEHADLILIIGSNPRISNHGTKAMMLALRPGAPQTVIVVDPRRTETADRADLHLAVRPGGDAWLLLGLLKHVLEAGLEDSVFVRDHVTQRDALAEALSGVTLEDLARRAGVPAEQVREVARRFATTERACVASELGVEHGPFSTLASWAERALLTLTGKLGRAGGQRFQASLVPVKPGGGLPTPRALLSELRAIKVFASRGLFSPALMPEEVLSEHPERPRALIIEGSNPMRSSPDTQAVKQALDRLELVVVIDPVMSETAREADFVLPCTVAYERWEMSLFPARHDQVIAHLRPPVLPRPEGCLDEPEIHRRLFTEMKLFPRAPWPLRALSPWAERPSVRHLITALAIALAGLPFWRGSPEVLAGAWLLETLNPHMSPRGQAIAWLCMVFNAVYRPEAALRSLGAAYRWRGPFARAEALWQRVLENPQGVEVARFEPEENLSLGVTFPDQRVRVFPEPIRAEVARVLAIEPTPEPGFPFVLSAGLRTKWTANTLHRDPGWRPGRGPHCALSVNPQDADELGIAEGEDVRIETRRGAALFPLRRDPRLQRGHVSAPNGFGLETAEGLDGVNVNDLTDVNDRDPFTGCPHHKHVPCRIGAPG